MTFSAREAAWEILERFERRTPGRRHQTLKLDACLERVFSSAKSASWRSEDRRFCTALTYGVLRRWLPYEARLQALSQFPWSRVAPVRALLQLGLFQLLDGDEIPPYAALNETVEQARRRGLSKASIAFVNGMLRAVQRQQAAGDWIPPSFEAEPSAHLAQVWNVPEWLGARWLLHYGKAKRWPWPECWPTLRRCRYASTRFRHHRRT